MKTDDNGNHVYGIDSSVRDEDQKQKLAVPFLYFNARPDLVDHNV